MLPPPFITSEGVNTTIHVALAPLPERLQGPLNVPVAGPRLVRGKLPVGVTGVPAIPFERSVTVTLQEDGVFTVTGLSQVTVVEAIRLFTVILKTAAELPAWVESPL